MVWFDLGTLHDLLIVFCCLKFDWIACLVCFTCSYLLLFCTIAGGDLIRLIGLYRLLWGRYIWHVVFLGLCGVWWVILGLLVYLLLELRFVAGCLEHVRWGLLLCYRVLFIV